MTNMMHVEDREQEASGCESIMYMRFFLTRSNLLNLLIVVFSWMICLVSAINITVGV